MILSGYESEMVSLCVQIFVKNCRSTYCVVNIVPCFNVLFYSYGHFLPLKMHIESI